MSDELPKNKYNLRKKKKVDYKINEHHDDSDSSYEPPDDTSEETDIEYEDNFDIKEYERTIPPNKTVGFTNWVANTVYFISLNP